MPRSDDLKRALALYDQHKGGPDGSQSELIALGALLKIVREIKPTHQELRDAGVEEKSVRMLLGEPPRCEVPTCTEEGIKQNDDHEWFCEEHAESQVCPRCKQIRRVLVWISDDVTACEGCEDEAREELEETEAAEAKEHRSMITEQNAYYNSERGA